MFRKNDEFECEITANGSGGEGICKINGFTIFVPNTVKGDVIKGKILKVKSGYAFGKAVDIITSSILRQTPLCNNSLSCGGCDIACMNYEYQLELKRSIVRDALERIGGISIEPEKTVGMDQPYYYRNKMQFPVGRNKDGEIVYGFYAKRSHNIIPAMGCVTGKKHCKPIMDTIVDFMKEKGIEPYDELSHKGIIRHVFLRDSAFSGEIMVVLVINAESLPYADELVQKLLQKEKTISGILLNINRKKTNLILGEKNIVLYGKDYITDRIGKLKFKISPHSFFQINSVQTEKLYNLTLDAAGDLTESTVFDLYCGTGTISLFMAQKAKMVYGIEIVDDAVENAKENAKDNNVKNAEFYSGAVEDIIEGLYNNGVRADVVVMDPPRKGSDQKTLDIIIKMKPSKIVYVSCDPATLARDLKILGEGGFKLEKAVPVDMFPMTSHVETVALLTGENYEQ